MIKQPTLTGFSAWVGYNWDAKMRGDSRDMAIPAMGLMGEAGEVGEHFKKFIRGDGVHPIANEALTLELGDVLHYWCRLCQLSGNDPHEVMRLNMEKCEKRYAEGKGQ
jgi:NTP pyrophosphatase (non-canonical NTP hydrolase)